MAWRWRWPRRHWLRDGRNVNEWRHHVVLSTAQKVFPLRKCVCSMQVFVQETGELRHNGSDCTGLVGSCFPKTHVELLELMPSHRKVDCRLLVGIDVHRVLVGVLLRGQWLVVFHSNDLEDQVRWWCTGQRGWR